MEPDVALHLLEHAPPCSRPLQSGVKGGASLPLAPAGGKLLPHPPRSSAWRRSSGSDTAAASLKPALTFSLAKPRPCG